MSHTDLTSTGSGGSIESSPSTAVSADTDDSTDTDNSVKRSNETSNKSPSVLRLIDSDNPDSSETAEYAKQFASEEKSPVVQDRVAELLDRDLNQKANDLAACSKWWGKYECSNGHTSKTEKRCNRPTLCPICESRPGGRAKEEYGDEILSWDKRVYRCLGDNTRYQAHELGMGMDNIYQKHKSFRKRRVNITARDIYNTRRHDPELARWMEHKVENNETVTMGDMIGGQLLGRHITDNGDGTYSIHLDIITDSWIPLSILNRVWERCGGKPNVQTKTIGKTNGRSYTESVLSAIAYVTEKVDIEDTADRVTFAEQRDGRRRYIALGSLYGSGDLISDRKITLECPYCGDSDLTYIGPTDERPSGREQTRVLMDGERIFGDKFNIPPPPD